MKAEHCSTFELAESMLSLNQNWILVRVGAFGAIFEDANGEFALSRRDMIRNLVDQTPPKLCVEIITTQALYTILM